MTWVLVPCSGTYAGADCVASVEVDVDLSNDVTPDDWSNICIDAVKPCDMCGHTMSPEEQLVLLDFHDWGTVIAERGADYEPDELHGYNPEQSPSYRGAMIDAGRGHLLP